MLAGRTRSTQDGGVNAKPAVLRRSLFSLLEVYLTVNTLQNLVKLRCKAHIARLHTSGKHRQLYRTIHTDTMTKNRSSNTGSSSNEESYLRFLREYQVPTATGWPPRQLPSLESPPLSPEEQRKRLYRIINEALVLVEQQLDEWEEKAK